MDASLSSTTSTSTTFILAYKYPSSHPCPLQSTPKAQNQDKREKKFEELEGGQPEGAMRPARVLSSSSGSSLWHTPIPYLFGGLGAMMILIAVALVVLACSHRKSAGDRSSTPADGAISIAPLDMEPRFVVIMAGEDKPTFLAKPFPYRSVKDAQEASEQQQPISPIQEEVV